MTALDEDYLTEHARQQQATAARHDHNDRCTTCRHRWHGLPCVSAGCDCGSSYVGQP